MVTRRKQPTPTRARLLRALMARAEALFYPPTCVLCGAPGEAGLDLCQGCRADMPTLGACCARCAIPLTRSLIAPTTGSTQIDEPDRPRTRLEPGPRSTPTRHEPQVIDHRASTLGQIASDILCGQCQRHPPPFRRCRAVYRYEGPLPALVAGMKFHARLNLVRLLGALLAEDLLAAAEAPDWTWPDAIVPVPLHSKRLRQRGYNQALELARLVSRQLALPVEAACCRRIRSTQAQSELEERQRLSNIRGAFAVTAPLPRHVVILDDVVTTGATVAELARTLRRNGCELVDVWALARTP